MKTENEKMKDKKIPFHFDGRNFNGATGFKCSNCKSEFGNRTDYKSGEGYIWCFDCGYTRDLWLKADNYGNLIRKDQTKDFSFDNLIFEESGTKNPYGSFNINYIESGWSPKPLSTKKDYEKAISKFNSELSQEHRIKKAEVSRFIDGRIVKEIIFPKAL